MSGNSEATSLPWSNLQNQIPAKVGRSGSTTAVNIDVTFDQARAVTQFVLWNHNLTTGGTVTLIGATNSSFSPAAVSAGVTIAADLPLLWEFASAQTYQYWRVQIEDSSLSYIEAGNIFLGPYDQFDLPNFATNLYRYDPSVHRESYGGSTVVFAKTQYRVGEVVLSPMQQADRRTLDSIYQTVGRQTGVYAFIDPLNQRDAQDVSAGQDGLHRFTIFGLLGRELAMKHLASDWQEVEALTIKELI